MRKIYIICFLWLCLSLRWVLFAPAESCSETSIIGSSSVFDRSAEKTLTLTSRLSLSLPTEERFSLSLSTHTFLPKVAREDKLIFGARPHQFERKQWEKIVTGQERLRREKTPESEGVQFDLPYDSKLSVAGRKQINVQFGKTVFKHPDQTTIQGTPSGAIDDVGMEQELQVKIKGKVGPKIAVDIDYDDTKEDKRDISVMYKGDPEEVVQEAAFGDIDLTLPQTEFVAYNKKLFGGKIDTQPISTDNHRLRVLGIGSRTKGITETKTFKGNTTFEKRELFDTQYVRRKYYKIYPNENEKGRDLPLQSGSEEVYVDNKNSTDDKNTTKYMTVENIYGKTVEGYFDKQNPGVDYTLDYRTGIITFLKPIGQNAVIAVDYRRTDGSSLSNGTGRKKIIKDELETPAVTRELKNHYSLGSTKIVNDANKFIIKILDLNRNELSPLSYEIDYDFGIIRFLDELPFARTHPDIYTNFPNHYYIIYVEYYHSVKTYNLRPGIVPKSESVKVNGDSLNRDEDYFIDYEIGLLTFLKDLVITNETEIEVSYEYMPFGGLFQQTIVGARSEYEYAHKLTVGSTVLYNWATPSGNVPDVRSTPESILVLEADSKLRLEPKQLWKLDLDGLQIDVGGEIARSKYNPNIFGKAMVDNMEGAEIADSVPADRKVWSLGSLSRPVLERGKLEWANGEEDIRTINDKSSDTGRMQVLDLAYEFDNTTSWLSLVNPISRTGIDYSKHLYMQMWIYGSGNGETLHIDLGKVSEDADGTGGFAEDQPIAGKIVWPKGTPKTEDKNNNGVLDVGEDVGWEFVHPTQGIIRIGAGNGRLDSEDLDGDGILTTSETIPVAISGPASYPIIINWSGWRQVVLPLDINDANLAVWQSVKQARLWLEKGGADKGTIRVAGMEIVGNRWDKPLVINGTGSMEVSVKSEEDDGNVVLKNYGDYLSLYEETINKDLDKNRCLVLTYTSLAANAEAYTRWQFSKAQDYSKHNKLKFFVYGDGKNEKFYLRIGADDNNYYEYAQAVTWTGWHTISVDLPNGFSDRKGYPNLQNISLIRLGIIGNGNSGEIWVDEIHLTEPKVEEGAAQKFNSGLRYSDWGTVNATYRDVDDKFSMVGVPKVNQSVASRSITSSLTKLPLPFTGSTTKVLPVNFAWDKTKTVTPSTFRTELSSQMEGIVLTDNLSVGTALTKNNLPRIGLNFKRNNNDSNLQQKINKTFTYGVAVSYNSKEQIGLGLDSAGSTPVSQQAQVVPKGQSPLVLAPAAAVEKKKFGFWSFFVPDSMNGYYNRIHGFTYYGLGLKKNQGFEDLFEETDDWMVAPTYQWQYTIANSANRLSLTPNYKRRKTAETKEFYDGAAFKRNKSDTQTSALAGQLELLRWLTPRFGYSMTTYDVYNVEASSKNVNRNATTELSYLLRMSDIWKWKSSDTDHAFIDIPARVAGLFGFDNLTVNNRYKVDEGDIYENVLAAYRTMDKLSLRQALDSGTLKSTNRLITYEHTTRWLPFKNYLWTESLTPLKTMDITGKYTKTNEHRLTTGTPYDSYTKIWPDFSVVLADLEKFISVLQKKRVFVESSQVTLKYYLRQIDKTNISYTREDFWSVNWVGRLFRKYTVLLNAENTQGKDHDPQGIVLRNSKTTQQSGQVNFSTKGNYRYIVRFEDKRQTDRDRFDVKSETKSQTPSIELKKDLEFPHGLKLPFIKKIWHLKNTVQLSTQLKTIMQRSTLAEKNNDAYSGAVNIDYNISYNFALSTGVQGSLVKNKLKEQEINDYYTYGGNMKLLIRF